MSRRGLEGTIVGAAVVMAALVVASLGRPVPLMSRPEGDLPTLVSLPTETTARPSTTFPSLTLTPTGGPFEPSPVLIALVQVVLVAVAVVLLAALYHLLRSLFRRRPHLEVHEEPSFEIPLVPTELLEAARDRLRELETGEPRNAIVAAWLALESSAAATGLPRLPAETSTEYTERVIGVWPVDSERLADLAALYREARFSVHDLGEDHRRRAIRDLRVLIADLDRVSSEQAAEQADHAAGLRGVPVGRHAGARTTGPATEASPRAHEDGR
jgi:hypothetical protein